MYPTKEHSPIKHRNSSVECYRILAIFFVLIVHFNGWLSGTKIAEINLLHGAPLWMYSQGLIEAFTLPCVNMFILITGYFGLKIKARTILDMLFLLLSIKIPFYLISVIEGEPFSTSNLVQQFRLISNAGYFVEDYLMLMFFSPVLNSFIEQKGRKILPWVITFALIEFYFEDIVHDEDMQFNRGYSLIHFVLMYFIGRCIWLFKGRLFTIKNKTFLIVFLLSSLITTFFIYAGIKTACFYASPFVIIAAGSLFVPFLKQNFCNRRINYIAKSVFCVYIFHTTPPLISLIRNADVYLLHNYTYVFYWIIGTIILFGTFVSGILYDKLRLIITEPITNILTKQIDYIISRER